MPRTLKTGDSGKLKVMDGMEHLVLCEGQDAWGFLVQYLNSEALSEYPKLSRLVQVEDFGGNEQLNTKLKLWSKAPGFQQLKTLVVIRDAEKNANGAVQSVKSAFQQSGLPVPSAPGEIHTGGSLATGFLLFPSCNNQRSNRFGVF